jgi:hypothetical protein
MTVVARAAAAGQASAMRRAFLSLLLVLVACGDDASGGDAAVPPDSGLDAAPDASPLLDAGADASLPACNDPFTGMPTAHDVVTDATPDGSVAFRLVRCAVMQGAGFSQIYRADVFELEWGGETHVVSDSDRIDYENTHHNWLDSLVAHAADEDLRWRVEYRGGSVNRYFYFVSAETTSGAPLLPETEIEGPTL